jgi:Undecaprenyl-phosphate galactose phosphotransferase WbaP
MAEQASLAANDLVSFGLADRRSAFWLERAAKTALDFFLAVIILIVALPFMLIIAAVVRLDGGPVFYAHPRIGRNGRPFHCYKFRTMVINADHALEELLKNDPVAAAEWAETHKLKQDVRITSIGRFLRASSLDELPQLFNIIRQDMTLVGPRPIVTEEVEKYGDRIDYYYAAKPGLTGMWQVSGRSDTTYGERVALDTWYVNNWSLLLDIQILMKTIPSVINRSGAC